MVVWLWLVEQRLDRTKRCPVRPHPSYSFTTTIPTPASPAHSLTQASNASCARKCNQGRVIAFAARTALDGGALSIEMTLGKRPRRESAKHSDALQEDSDEDTEMRTNASDYKESDEEWRGPAKSRGKQSESSS